MPTATPNFDPLNVKILSDRILDALRRKIVTQTELCGKLAIEKSKFSRWINGKSSWRSIGYQNYEQLWEIIEADNSLNELHSLSRTSIPGNESRQLEADFLFLGVAKLFGLERSDIDSACNRLVGNYACYRYSYLAPPDILKGNLEIQHPQNSKSLKTIETYYLREDALGPGSKDLKLVREGYIWPTKSNMYVMISEKPEGRGFQISFLNRQLSDSFDAIDPGVHTMEGMVVDWHESDCYMAKIFIQKQRGPMGKDDIGLFKEGEISDLIKSRLQEAFEGPHSFLRAYR